MSRKKARTLTDHELRLMEVLWQRDRATVADVVDLLAPPPLAYSTVLTTLRTLEQKGYVAHEEEGRAYVYHPLVARAEAAKSATRLLLDRFFGNSPGALALTLLTDTQLSGEDVAKIKRMLARSRKASQ
jgi:predicted transcriptional regulator